MNKCNQKLYAILVNQLSPAICSNLEGMTGYEQVEADQYGIAILAMIKKVTCSVE